MKIQKTAGCMLQEQMDASSSPARPPLCSQTQFSMYTVIVLYALENPIKNLLTNNFKKRIISCVRFKSKRQFKGLV